MNIRTHALVHKSTRVYLHVFTKMGSWAALSGGWGTHAMYMYKYTLKHVGICIYIHTCARAFVRGHTCTHSWAHMYIFVGTHVYMHTNICVDIHWSVRCVGVGAEETRDAHGRCRSHTPHHVCMCVSACEFAARERSRNSD